MSRGILFGAGPPDLWRSAREEPPSWQVGHFMQIKNLRDVELTDAALVWYKLIGMFCAVLVVYRALRLFNGT